MISDHWIKLTRAEIAHILYLIDTNEDDGSYYAPKNHYWNRSDRIKKKLSAIVKTMYKTTGHETKD